MQPTQQRKPAAPTQRQLQLMRSQVLAPPSPAQARRMAEGRIEADLSEYWHPHEERKQEGRVRRAIEDIHEARRLGITLEEYRAL